MDVLERLYEINNFNVHTKRKQRIEQLQKKAQIAKKNRGDLIEKMKLRKSLLVSAPEEKVIHIDTEETEEETKVDENTEEETKVEENTEEETKVDEKSDQSKSAEEENVQPVLNMDDVENKQNEDIEDTDSEDEFDMEEA